MKGDENKKEKGGRMITKGIERRRGIQANLKV